MDVVLLATVSLATLATIVGLAGLAILGPRQERIGTEVRAKDSVRRRALVEMAEAHSRPRPH